MVVVARHAVAGLAWTMALAAFLVLGSLAVFVVALPIVWAVVHLPWLAIAIAAGLAALGVWDLVTPEPVPAPDPPWIAPAPHAHPAPPGTRAVRIAAPLQAGILNHDLDGAAARRPARMGPAVVLATGTLVREDARWRNGMLDYGWEWTESRLAVLDGPHAGMCVIAFDAELEPSPEQA